MFLTYDCYHTGRSTCVVAKCSQNRASSGMVGKAASLAMGAAAAAAMTLSGLTNPMAALAVPQTSACATESCDGVDYSNR